MTSQITTESYRAGMIQVTETVFETLLNTPVTVLDATPLDATSPDATSPDATSLDATSLDATSPDATSLDATSPDATSAAPAFALTAAIYYAGLWQGALLIECSEQQASAWSSHIMDLPDPTEEDARDGIGELANVLAGNLKPLLPPGVSISIPWVVAGGEYSVHVLRDHAIERVAFADERGPFRVTFARVEP
jgi:chemotaxis protein CheX